MSLEERTGERDLTYSRWHRPSSVRHHLGRARADVLSVIDIDFCEYCFACGQPLALVETQESRSSGPKSATVTQRVAEMCGIECYSLTYVVNDEAEIDGIRFRQLSPRRSDVFAVTADGWAEQLWEIRERHRSDCRNPAAWSALDRRLLNERKRGAA